MNRAAYFVGWVVGRLIAIGSVAGDWFRDGFERGREWLPLKPDPSEFEPEEIAAVHKLNAIFDRALSKLRAGNGKSPWPGVTVTHTETVYADPNDRYEAAGYDRPNPPLPVPESNGDGRSVSAGDDVPTR